MKAKLFLLSCLFLRAGLLSAQSFTEGADLPGTGSGPSFTVSGPSITIAGHVNTPADGQDRFQIVVPAGCQITSVTYSMTDNASIGANGFFQFGAGNQQPFPPLTGTFTSGPFGPFPVGAGTYDCMIAANVAANDSWSMVFNTNCTTAIPEIANNNSVRIYPNPASDFLFVHVKLDAEQNGIFEIDNVFGQRVAQYQLTGGENNFTVHAAEFATGIYFCKTEIEGETIKTEKIIIQQ